MDPIAFIIEDRRGLIKLSILILLAIYQLLPHILLAGRAYITSHFSYLFQPQICIPTILAWASYVGNLDRKRWLYALTAIFASPVVWKCFWPLRDLELDLDFGYRPLRKFYKPDEKAAVFLLAAALSWYVTRVFITGSKASKEQELAEGEADAIFLTPVREDLVTSDSSSPTIRIDSTAATATSSLTTDESIGPVTATPVSATVTTTITFHFAKRPRHLLRPRPKKLNLDPCRDDCESTWDYAAISKEEKRLASVPWRKLNKRPEEVSAEGIATPAAQRPLGFDEYYDVTPGLQPYPDGAQGPFGFDGYSDLTSGSRPHPPHEAQRPFGYDESSDAAPERMPDPTPEWARVDRNPPTPLSAARMENFVAPKGPGKLVMSVQTIASWRPIGEWLCDPTVDQAEKWDKARETIDQWRQTCNQLTSSRIARYNIGTSADTTELVLGPMHLSMHDLRDFFDTVLQEQETSASNALDLFRKEYQDALRNVATTLVQMAKDYPQNSLVLAMARLAAKIKKSAEWWRKKVELNAIGIFRADAYQKELKVEHGTDVELTPGEAIAIIDDWNHSCKLWSLMSKSRFMSMVHQQCGEPTSSLARMATQMLALRAFANEASDMMLPEQSHGQLVFVVSILEKKCKELGQLAVESQFDMLVADVRHCAAALQPTKQVGQTAPSDVADSPETPVSKAKHEFMTKLLKLGKEEREKQFVASTNAASALKRDGVVDAGQYARESERRQASASDPVAISDKVLQQRVKPWFDLLDANPHGLQVIERRRQEAAKLLDRTEASPTRPHASKSRKRGQYGDTEDAFAASSHDVPSEHKHDTGSKRHLGDTNFATQKSNPVTRDNIHSFGRRWENRDVERKNREALAAGTLSGFDRAIAENQVSMYALQEQRWFDPRALEMDESSAAVDEERVEEVKPQPPRELPNGWTTKPIDRDWRETLDREAAEKPKAESSEAESSKSETAKSETSRSAPAKHVEVAKTVMTNGRQRPLAATVEDALDSEEEL